MNLKYRIANINEADRVCYIVQHTIEVIYPDYYSQAVVDFFGKLHSIDNIKKDIEQGRNGVLIFDGEIIAVDIGIVQDSERLDLGGLGHIAGLADFFEDDGVLPVHEGLPEGEGAEAERERCSEEKAGDSFHFHLFKTPGRCRPESNGRSDGY